MDLSIMGLAMLQTYMNIQRHLMNYGKTMDDVVRFLRVDYKEWFKKRDEIAAKIPGCPECGRKLVPFDVNTNFRNQVGGDYTVQWLCHNDCEYEKFTKEDYSQWQNPEITEITEMAKILAAFSLDDLETAVELSEKIGDSTKDWKGKAVTCPDCGCVLRLFSISNNECHWVCMSCRFSIYKPHSREKEKKAIGFKE
jgi:hypothetical protein